MFQMTESSDFLDSEFLEKKILQLQDTMIGHNDCSLNTMLKLS